jgi:hypothetical protein
MAQTLTRLLTHIVSSTKDRRGSVAAHNAVVPRLWRALTRVISHSTEDRRPGSLQRSPTGIPWVV